MKKYRITVNGNAYDVEVEELQDKANRPVALTPQPQPEPAKRAAAPRSKTQPSPKHASSSPKALKAPMPGTILDIKVKEGEEVKKGQVLMILEAMKMENEILASDDGKVKGIYVQKGASVNTGDPLVDFA